MSASGVLTAPAQLASRQTRGTRSGRFTPRLLPGLSMWLDALNVDGQYNATLNDGDQVATWRDLSGNGHDATQGVAASRPLFRKANPNLLTYNQSTVETDASGWQASTGGPTIASTSVNPLQGSKSWTMTATAAGPAVMTARTPNGVNAVPVQGGRTYAFSFVARMVTAVVRGVAPQLNWYDAGGTFISSTSTATTNVDNTAPVTLSMTAVAPANAAFCAPGPTVNAALLGDQVEIDMAGFYADALPAAWLAPVLLPAVAGAAVQFLGAHLMSTTLGGAAQPQTQYVVAMPRSQQAAGNRRPYGSLFQRNDGLWVASVTGSTVNGFAAAVDRLDVVGAVYNGAAAVVSVNGAENGGNIGAGAVSGFVGGNNAGGELFDGEVLAVIQYARALAQSERTLLQGYLRARYGTP